MWRHDGAGTRARIGVLTPHLDPVPETEFQAMAPEGVSTHTARVPLGMVQDDGTIVPDVGPEIAKAFSEPPEVDRAAARLAPLSLGAIVYAFTSSSYVLGASADGALSRRLQDKATGAPVVIQSQALVAGLDALGIKRITLVHPPWFSRELDGLGVAYFGERGIEVVNHGPADIRQDYGEIEPQQVFDWVTSRTSPRAEAVVIGGGGFRAVGVIDALEDELDRPVLTANQASFWQALRLSGIDDEPDGYGRLFAH
ncbi:MAG: hypothetical protein R3316_10900 [Rhodovibrionaceae bacterium]|nr:hypothetical protein [Rhodovibrionaceae bacterium]